MLVTLAQLPGVPAAVGAKPLPPCRLALHCTATSAAVRCSVTPAAGVAPNGCDAARTIELSWTPNEAANRDPARASTARATARSPHSRRDHAPRAHQDHARLQRGLTSAAPFSRRHTLVPGTAYELSAALRDSTGALIAAERRFLLPKPPPSPTRHRAAAPAAGPTAAAATASGIPVNPAAASATGPATTPATAVAAWRLERNLPPADDQDSPGHPITFDAGLPATAAVPIRTPPGETP